jgi:hypothetical protein
MAPTEILREQHYINVHRWFGELGVPGCCSRREWGASRRDVLDEIRTVPHPHVIGTTRHDPGGRGVPQTRPWSLSTNATVSAWSSAMKA